jgi:putative oxidoreductase
MSILHSAARTMLASMFVYAGVDALRTPAATTASDGDPGTDRAAWPDDTDSVVRVNGAVQVGAGLLLATGRLRRPAALALAGTLLPTTPAGQRHWETAADATRSERALHVLRNVGLLGGLLIAAMDTEGEPGVAWRAQHAVEHASIMTDHAREVAGLQAELARERTKAATAGARHRVGATAKQARRDAKLAAKAGRGAAGAVASAGRTARKAVAAAIPG